VRITDLSRVDNPHLQIAGLHLDSQNFLNFGHILHNSLPWQTNSSKVTMKIEVLYDNKLIVQRFVHFDKLYELEYSKIALQIAHNYINMQSAGQRTDVF
jgi:hypothetical protein